MKRWKSGLVPVIGAIPACLIIMSSCNKKPVEPPPRSVINGILLDQKDSSVITHANIVVYDATTNAPVTRTFSGDDGKYTLFLGDATVYLKIEAQGYVPSPPKDGRPVPFAVTIGDTVTRDVLLEPDPSSSGTGYITGEVSVQGSETMLQGFLVVARRTTDSLTKTTVSGPGGVYVIYNVQPGDYSVKAYSSGYYQANDSLYRTVKADSALRNVNVSLVSGYKSNKFN